jgi:hypothetical protein
MPYHNMTNASTTKLGPMAASWVTAVMPVRLMRVSAPAEVTQDAKPQCLLLHAQLNNSGHETHNTHARTET